MLRLKDGSTCGIHDNLEERRKDFFFEKKKQKTFIF